MEDTRIIKLPSRSTASATPDSATASDRFKALAQAAMPVDMELASIIAAWSSLPRGIKDNILTLICIRQ